jgi:long-subunit acyl-CoA synthetase (AMP-forming)
LGRPACYAVIQLGEDAFKKFSDQAFRDEITPKLEELLNSVNAQIEEFEKVQFLAVVKDEWQTANNFLTPTLKIKRDIIEETYAPFLDDWYDCGYKVIWQD